MSSKSSHNRLLGTLDWQFFHESELSTNPLNSQQNPKYGRRSMKSDDTIRTTLLNHHGDSTPQSILTSHEVKTSDPALLPTHHVSNLTTHDLDVESLKQVSLLNPPVDDPARPMTNVPLNLIIAAFAQIQDLSCDTAARLLLGSRDDEEISKLSIPDPSGSIPQQNAVDRKTSLSALQFDDVSLADVSQIKEEMSRVEDAWMHATLNGRETVSAAAVQHWIMDAGWLNDEDMRDDFDDIDPHDDGSGGSGNLVGKDGKDSIIWRETSRVLPVRDISVELRMLLEQDPDTFEDHESLDAAYVAEKEALASGMAIKAKKKSESTTKDSTSPDDSSKTGENSADNHQGTSKRRELSPKSRAMREKVRAACQKTREQHALTLVEQKKAIERVERRGNYGAWHIPAKHWEARLKEKLGNEYSLGNTSESTLLPPDAGSDSKAKQTIGAKTGKGPVVPTLQINGVTTVPDSVIHGGNTTRYLNTHKIFEDEDADLDFEITVYQPGQKRKDLFAHYK